ncbi:MAG: NIPSNAP family protein [Acidobacteriota bacterium]|nr:NIPSNAP family protein [Acidobacteriota bacterium]
MIKAHIVSFLLGGLAVSGATIMLNAQSSTQVYELRTYTAPAGKLDALEARFRDRTETLFKRHDIKVVGYWVPTDNKNNEVICIAEHKSQEDAAKNWAAFQADDEWKKIRAETEVGGSLTVKHPDSVYMRPLDFSKLR